MQYQLDWHIPGIWYRTDRHEQWKRVTASFFVKDLGLTLAPKMCPDQSQALKRSKIIRRFRGKKKQVRIFFFGTSRFQVLEGMSVHSFAQIFEELTA